MKMQVTGNRLCDIKYNKYFIEKKLAHFIPLWPLMNAYERSDQIKISEGRGYPAVAG